MVIKKVRLGAGAPAIGIPFFWPSSAMPNTVITEWADMVFLKFNGATFSATTYPKLALVFPGLTLAEARGEFLRVWDDGRGIDSGRQLLSAQGDAIRNITGQFFAGTSGNSQYVLSGANGVFSRSGMTLGPNLAGSSGTGDQRSAGVGFDASLQVPTATENRPRNIAFNFLVRAK
ncbi:TPA: hypothetical protein ACHTQU_002056 [Escherichia coli]